MLFQRLSLKDNRAQNADLNWSNWSTGKNGKIDQLVKNWSNWSTGQKWSNLD